MTSTFDARYVCSLSGASAPPLDDEAESFVGAEDDLEDLPVGWARVLIEVRRDNPDWHLLHAARMGLINESVQQMGESVENRRLAEILVDGQLSGALDTVPRFLTQRETVNVSAAYLEHLRELLGVLDDNEEDLNDSPAELAPAPADPPVGEAATVEATPASG